MVTRIHLCGESHAVSRHRVVPGIEKRMTQRSQYMNYLINTTELSPSWEPTSSSAIRGFPNILWNTKVHYCAHKSTVFSSVRDEFSPYHPIQFSKIHFTIGTLEIKHRIWINNWISWTCGTADDWRDNHAVNFYKKYLLLLQCIQGRASVCGTLVSCYILALWKMKIPLLLYCLLNVQVSLWVLCHDRWSVRQSVSE
jgi:hypothetical protein